MNENEVAIWNRACDFRSFSPALTGDMALRWAISFDGVACNGGVIHSIEFHAENLSAVFDAFRTLGAHEMPELLTKLSAEYASASQAERSRTEREFDRRYRAAMTGDRLTELFQAFYQSNPNSFQHP